jgi:hypothetical protein
MKRSTIYLSVAAGMLIAAASQARAQSGPNPELDWMLGNWVHRSQTPEGEALVVKRVCQRTLGGHYLTALTQIEVAGQVVLKNKHMARFDPARQKYHSWVFSSNGDFAHGMWEQLDTRHFGGELVGQTVDGKRKSATSTYEWVDGDTYIYRLMNRQTAGNSLPDIEWDFHRVPSAP